MLARLLKSFLPRSLYARAALIIFVPVLTILLVVSLTFIQRHYEGVTRQMTANFLLVVDYATATIESQADPEAARIEAARLGQAFRLELDFDPAPPPREFEEPLPVWDLSGRLALRELGAGLEDLLSVRIEGNAVTIWLPTHHGALRIGFPMGRISARNPHQMLVLTLVIGLGMGVVAFIYLKNQMRPMARLARAAEAFGRGQTLPFRPSGATEVRAAGAAFLQMRNRIERHIEQRTLLLSGVSHDLRTPLTRMRLALSMLEDEPEARAILADVTEMEALIDRFLEFARAEATEPAQPVDLGALVRERVAHGARGGRDLRFEGAGQGPVVTLRPQLLARALDNLFGNALRYGSRARVALHSTPASAVIEVEDDGPGIAPEDVERAVQPFVRLDPARNAGRGSGAGLGLAIVADAMRSHGGRLDLGPGTTPGYGGLRARLVLPLTPTA